ncbi:ribose/galactose ABC transporter substrate-binding protein [Spiroplasma litorale]|uniref:Ribose/galactose ABC transporter substrate-binding protein n=1 Tax=Spiroplasma litorale TaxID=216942 RepID=A0A0K1W0Y3_9MOLU|nr:hypothetical protein [Spiroplasma litorale]AKX33984.1 ribose/galactose ABC transporter substrate-binding protein [Spiroplasma litorale]
MKKLLSGLLAFSIIGSSMTNVISCSNNKSFNDIFLITDAGRISDKSFNESGKVAGDKFIKEISELNKDDSYSGIGFTEPEDVSKIQDGYDIAKKAGAKVAILPGFHHAGDNLKAAANALGENSTQIIIDGNDEGIKTAIGLLYKADMSGFYAGMASIYQSIKDKKWNTVGDEKIVKLATFGGQSNYVAVELFMVGFLSAIDVYNELSTNNKDVLNNIFGEEVQYDGIKASRVSSQKNAPKDGNDKNWYSTSFAAGDGKVISESLVNDDANVIMPVAGPQTADLLGVINQKNKQNDVKVVGVDTNQAEAYASDYSNSFITSAEKNIVDSTIIALAGSKEYYNNDTVVNNIKKYYKDNNLSLTFDKKSPLKDKSVEEMLGSDLTGNTLWTPGDISYSDNSSLNSITKEVADKIKTTFSSSVLNSASSNFFKGVEENTYTPQKLLEITEKYAKDIIESIKK